MHLVFVGKKVTILVKICVAFCARVRNVQILQTGALIYSLDSTERRSEAYRRRTRHFTVCFVRFFAHERVFPSGAGSLCVCLLMRGFCSHKRAKLQEEKTLTSGLNYLYLIRERGTFVFTAAAWGSNTEKESSYVHGVGVTPQRNKNRIQSVFHNNLMLLVFALMIAGFSFAPLSAGDVE